MKSRNKRFSAFLLAGAMLASLITPRHITSASSNSIVISDAEGLMRFAENCTLDSWSRNKTITLEADINLAYNDWTPIPIFGGTFKGNGHTISGVRITSTGSDMGLFRFVEEGGIVENLNVSGTVMPNGAQTAVGGIVGMTVPETLRFSTIPPSSTNRNSPISEPVDVILTPDMV